MSPVLALAGRHLRRRWLASALIALSLAGGMAVFLLIQSHVDLTSRRMAGTAQPVAVPGEAMYVTSRFFDAAEIASLQRIWGAITEFEAGYVFDAYTSAGMHRAVALAPESMAAGVLPLSEGAWPAEPGQVMLPLSLARQTGLSVGDRFTTFIPAPPGGYLMPVRHQVVGLFTTGFGLLETPVYSALDAKLRPGVRGPNLLIVGGGAVSIPERTLQQIYTRLDATLMYTSGHGHYLAGNLAKAALAGGVPLAMLIFLMSGLGALNILLLGFLQRKRSFGILKALGASHNEARAVLMLEAAVTSVAGAALGLAGSAAGLALLRASAVGGDYRLTPASVSLAVVFTVSIGMLAGHIPGRLCRDATVDQLLHNRRVYLDTNPSCAQCGRCGGF